MKKQEIRLTVGELIAALSDFPKDWDVSFQGGLEFNRLKIRGPTHVCVEFNQMIYRADGDRAEAQSP